MKVVVVAAGVIVAGLLLGLSAGGCGGSGGAAVPNQFLGSYFLQGWSGIVAGPSNAGAWGSVNANGMGTQTSGTLSLNFNGSLSLGNATDPLPYSISAGRRLTRVEVGGDTEGGIAADGSIAALGTITPSAVPGIVILGRKGSGFGLGSLVGEYHLGAFFWNGSNEVSWWGTFQSDGAGNVMLDEGLNVNGMITMPDGLSGAGTYTVEADGAVTWTHPFAVLEGGIMAGGELVVLSGSTLSDNRQLLVVLIRKGTGLGPATFDGNYHYVRIAASNAPPPRYTSLTGVSAADGVNAWTLGATTANQDGGVTTVPSAAPQAYTVSSTGTLALTSLNLVGGVSSSGNVAMLSGGTGNTSSPQLWVLVR